MDRKQILFANKSFKYLHCFEIVRMFADTFKSNLYSC